MTKKYACVSPCCDISERQPTLEILRWLTDQVLTYLLKAQIQRIVRLCILQ